ncbi:30S ribosomal protein S4 [Ichthyobacterium seriolicida]|uniref:Small ribosomal subunit protein uS4 n=1 Tax=Ichthyobacterium seriolicida TaxID=242600 RepID=A0A1J1DYA0_9FLAO|nr:30S ribosomal protein S4 [Ichthyobacterium seriolicida]BAV94833.1 30S ribosomal protein S4p [Ichthyobacterium seriolicida]
MARYIGPKTKIARKFGDPILGEDKYFEKRKYPSGEHGFSKRRGKKSEYSVQLEQKQKAKYTYGILEKQFSNMFRKASRIKGITGEVLLQLCESRLDNVVYRLGISPTRASSRQLVSHRHITVNGNTVSIPSYTLKPGDKIGIREKSKYMQVIEDSLSSRVSYDWLTWDEESRVGSFVSVPERSQIPENIKEQLVVELYSK